MGDSLLVITKFVLGVLLLPMVWATVLVFHQHAAGLPGSHGEFLFWGAFSYLMLFLFFHHFGGMYEFGQKVCSGIFQFVAPVNKFIAKIVPLYLILILLGFYVTTNFLGIKTYDHYFMFFAGFAFAMHLILTAQELQSDQKMFLKPEYLFTGSIVFILLIFMVVLLFDLAFGKLTVQDFARSVWSDAFEIYNSVWQRLIMRK